jgi:hypothetical protein
MLEIIERLRNLLVQLLLWRLECQFQSCIWKMAIQWSRVRAIDHFTWHLAFDIKSGVDGKLNGDSQNREREEKCRSHKAHEIKIG